jgi:hypothetical protein
MQLSNYDWKKAAAQVMDDGTVERAFMDQAYGFLTNKAGKLMQDPYRLGFEVVYKNDSNTRMVGIFAFRVNDQIMYVPVFFLNGEIKGTDLLYRQETKTFVPLNDEWVTYLTEKNNYEPGMPVDRKEFTRANNHVRLEDIAYPPNYKRDKRASVIDSMNTDIADAYLTERRATIFSKVKEKKADSDTASTFGDIDMIIEAAFEKEIPATGTLLNANDKTDKPLASRRKEVVKNLAKSGQLLRKFITEDGGVEAISKLASLMEDSFEFTEALVSNIDEKDYMPEDLQVKQASSNKAEPTLVLFAGRPGKTEHSYLLKQADETKDPDKHPAVNKFAEKFFSQGYYLWDDRAASDLIPVYKDNEERLDMLGGAGIYDVLLHDGSFRKAIVAPKSQTDFNCSSAPLTSGSYSGDSWNIGGVVEDIKYNSTSRSMYPDIVICYMDGEKESDMRRQVHGKFVKDQAQMLRDGDLDKEMSSKKAYRIFDVEAGALSAPFYVESKREEDGITYYSVCPMHGASDLMTLTHNPDMTENDLRIGFLGAHVAFVPVGMDSYTVKNDTYDGRPYHNFHFKRICGECEIGDVASLDAWVTEYVKKASLLYDRDSDTYSLRTGSREQTDYMERLSMAVKLATAGFHADAVDEMLTSTKSAGQTNWYFGDPEMNKVAFPIMQNRDAIFRTTTNQDFKVNQEYPQSFILKTNKDSLQLPPQIVGDAYDPGMGVKPDEQSGSHSGMSKEQLMTMSPDQIAQFASSNKLPNVFEHGLVGSLVQVYDSMSMIDKYIPDMEEALDRLGRILFLFYWKPRDFEDAYGADDMTNLENQILSNFKSFGSLVLDLLKRSKKRKLGNVSMGT